MFKRIAALVMTIVSLFSLTGCAVLNSSIPPLSEEDQDLVVEYASSTLLKYDKKNGDKYLASEEPESEMPSVEVVDAPEPEPTPEPAPEPEEDVVIDASEDLSTEEGVDKYVSVSEALGLSGEVDIVYEGYEIKNHYPDSLDAYFVMNATEGCDLLIMKFNMTNVSSAVANVDVAGSNSKFKIVLNGAPKNALTTLLLNDLAFYKGELSPGQSEEVVIVGEYPKAELENISDLGLNLKQGENTFGIRLN